LTPKPTPIQPQQPPNTAQTILDYLAYTGALQYGLSHPLQLTQTLNTLTAGKPWALQAYTCADNILILEAQNGNVQQASSAVAFTYTPTCTYTILQLGG
ncbi:MAG: hypothetical protein QW688_01415, partial [Thermoprotei archaeon]